MAKTFIGRAIIYVRVSTDDQADNYSIETQSAACRKYAEERGFSVVAELQDVMSGAKLDRPGLTKVRELVEQKHTDLLIIYCSDRLTRSLAHSLLLRDEFKTAGVAIHSVTKGESLDTPEGNLFDSIEGAFAEYERMKIRERMVRGKRGKAESGVMIGHSNAPYGYCYVGEKHDKRLELNEDEAAVMRLIGSWILSGESVIAIRKRLSEMCIPSPSDTRRIPTKKVRPLGEWSLSGLYHLVRNPVYTGTYYAFRKDHYSKRRPLEQAIPISIPAIFDQETWEAIQAKLDEGKRFSPRNTKRFYLLRCRVRCGHCGYSGSGCAIGRRADKYYHCSNKRRSDRVIPCDLPYFHAAHVECAVWEWIITDVLNEERIRDAVQDRVNNAEAASTKLMAERERYYHQLANLDSQIDRLANLYRLDLFTIEQISKQKAELDVAVSSTRQEIEKLDGKIQDFNISQEDAAYLCTFVQQVRSHLNPEVNDTVKRQIIDLLDTQVTLRVIDGEKFVDVVCYLTLDQVRLGLVRKEEELLIDPAAF